MKLAHLIRRDPAASTLRERAAALREGLSRREAVLGAAVAVAPIPAMAASASQAHPDAALIASGQRWAEAYRVERAASARWDAIPNAASGHDEAEAAWTACDAILEAIEHEIAAAKAHTLAGITIKARLAQSLDDRCHRVSDDLIFEIIRGVVALDTPAA